jgi:transcription-repair coupling factor (superfamily II helicase)
MPTRLVDLLQETTEYQSLAEGLRRGLSEQMVYGVTASFKSFLAAGLRAGTGRPCLVVTATQQAAERFREDLATWLPEQEAVLFPPMEYFPFEVVAHSPEVVGQRLAVLQRLAAGENLIVVAPAAALYRALTPRSVFQGALLTLETEMTLDRDDLVARLVRKGYERVDMVESKGQVAVRGEVVDLFPLASDQPVRVAFWGDVIDELRIFDPVTQRTLEKVQRVTVGPAREFIVPAGDLSPAISRIRQDLAAAVKRLEKLRPAPPVEEMPPEEPPKKKGRKKAGVNAVIFEPVDSVQKLTERVEGHLAKLTEGIYFEGLEQYANFFYEKLETLLDYFETPPIVLVDEPARIRETSSEQESRDTERQVSMLEKGNLLPGQLGLYLNAQELFHQVKRHTGIYFSALGRGVPGLRPQNEVGITATAMQEFHGQWPLFQEELARWKKQNYRIIILAATDERKDRLRQTLADAGYESTAGEGAPGAPLKGAIWIGRGTLEGGFQWPGQRLVVVTDGEIYGRPKKRRRPVAVATQENQSNREIAKIASYQDLKIGDYVVHVVHGIGKYMGVQTETVLGATRDYLVIKYEGTDRLKIPTEQIDQIQKYIGAEGHEPRLNKLGGSEWSKVKNRVKESVREMAAELLKLAAYRETLPGHAFSPDTVWQKEFEDAFPYEETPDQLKSIREIKADMEKPRPMDRLLLGDVGYGKTEVALRAAFKAAMDQKQVAFLVPTTILAQQHYTTIKNRMEGFPLNVAVLNRFKSAKEQQQILKGLADGTIDIVVGTHSLLSEHVRFKDLGLLIIDEEQRFGVQHKERIKLLKQNVDVLTLSATPIPRTLHMALVGLREMSVITSPPEDRYPVETFVAEYDEELIRDAIGRELARGGQVFFVHNRVQSIEKVARKIQELVPEARVSVAHGQMKEDRFERVLLEFLEGETDVLVATTIIESGVDIPTVNTIIVDDADHLGLAQLYQLRGRVGRSNRLAYAYFLYRRDKSLTEVAEKRLRAIKEFTELGSGFKIAMRDLEIRGAGNILGPEQHGFIMTVGFDLYTQLLEEAVLELKGEAPPPKEMQPVVELQVDAFLPDSFIPDARQKIEAYKRITSIRKVADVEEVALELTDRFGTLPDPVKNLLDIAALKVEAATLGITAISQTRDQVTIKFLPGAGDRIAPDRYTLLNRKPEFKGRIAVPRGVKVNAFTLSVRDLTGRSLMRTLRALMAQLAEYAFAGART